MIDRGIGKNEAELFTAMFEGVERMKEAKRNQNKMGFDAFNQAFLNGWEEGYNNNDQGREVLVELRELFGYVEETPANKYIKIDPSLARGLSYYTGAIFVIYTNNKIIKSQSR